MIPIGTDEPSNIATPAAARRLLRDELDGWDGPEVVDDAELLVSELVTNVIVHGKPMWFKLHARPAPRSPPRR
ncbi:MAG: ATP-binding protein [Acidimicrobiales bacterium]